MKLDEYLTRINPKVHSAFRNWLGVEASEDHPLAWWVIKFRRFAKWVMGNEN